MRILTLTHIDFRHYHPNLCVKLSLKTYLNNIQRYTETYGGYVWFATEIVKGDEVKSPT